MVPQGGAVPRECATVDTGSAVRFGVTAESARSLQPIDGWIAVGTSFIRINDVASAQFDFRDEDWADRSQLARELALSINGYEVSPQPRGYVCHRPRWVWIEADAGPRKVPWNDFRLLVPTDALTPIAPHAAGAAP